MKEYLVMTHPVNSKRVVIFNIAHSMKMLAVNEYLEPELKLKAEKNFYKASFIKADNDMTVHFYVMSTLTKDILEWKDGLIFNAVNAYNDDQQIGVLQSLIQTESGKVIFEKQTEKSVAA